MVLPLPVPPAVVTGSITITALDIVELRKLILGIYTSALPNANSWRFIDKDLKSTVIGSSNPFLVIHTSGSGMTNAGGTQYSAISPYNYFANEEFDEFVLPPSTSMGNKAKFVGFKVGDVSGNALPGFGQVPTNDRDVTSLTLGATAVKGRSGNNVEIPVFSLVQQSLNGWQMALQYDTSLLVIKGIRWPADLSYGQGRDWHVTQPGELRLLWFAAEGIAALAPGTPLFFVQAELRQTLSRSQTLLQLASSGTIFK